MKILNTSTAQLIAGLLLFVNLISQVNAGGAIANQDLLIGNAGSYFANTRHLNKSNKALLAQNGKIAFEEGSLVSTTDHEIYIMDSNGSNQTRLTNNSAYDGDPFFSPDGTKIVFPSRRDGNNAQIYVMNSNGTAQTRITNNAFDDHRPAFSPDGAKIVFSRGSGAANSHEIYIMNNDGSNQVRITNNSVADEYPKWSPDGSKIIFNSNRDGGDRDIFVMNIDGSNVVQLTANNSIEDAEASFSPDGTKILFFSTRDGIDNPEVYVMNNDGSNPVNVSNSPGSDGSCSWSPDGQKIAFISRRDGNTEVYTMNANGTGQTRLTNNNLLDNTPVWGAALIPTSANVSISGQVLTYDGNPISGAKVSLFDSNGSNIMVISNSFGHYQFDDVRVGETYIISVTAKQFSFTPQIISLNEAMVGLNLIAEQ